MHRPEHVIAHLHGAALVLFFWSMHPTIATASGETAPLRCAGTYADDPSVLNAEVRDFDRNPEAVFSRCTRNTAIYECLSYGPDGTIRRQRTNAVLHGTALPTGGKAPTRCSRPARLAGLGVDAISTAVH
jgi:hypothetical protein